MPVASWSEFDTLVALFGREAQTGARAAGRALMTLFEASRYPARQPHWLDWERHKALRLLRPIDRVA